VNDNSAVRGRPIGPRSARAQEAVPKATSDLLAEDGLLAAAVDVISMRAGVSTATTDKHWPSRIAVAAEAFGQVDGHHQLSRRSDDRVAGW
jgi:AcrR family transcriptional regulator